MKAWVIMGNGRIGRLRSVAYSVWLLLVILPVILIQINLALQGQTTIALVLDVALAVVTTPINIMFGIRRLHDINRSGWWAVIQIPMSLMSPRAIYDHSIIGPVHVVLVVFFIVIAIYALTLLLVPGSKGNNRFGPPPPPNSGWVIAGVIIGIVLPFAACSVITVLHAGLR